MAIPGPARAVTAFGDVDVHLWAQQLGAVAMFDKPFDVDDLETVLRNLRGPHRAGAGAGGMADVLPKPAPW